MLEIKDRKRIFIQALKTNGYILIKFLSRLVTLKAN